MIIKDYPISIDLYWGGYILVWLDSVNWVDNSSVTICCENLYYPSSQSRIFKNIWNLRVTGTWWSYREDNENILKNHKIHHC
jgi:hypothetical protein